MLSEQTRKIALLDMLFMNRKELMGAVMVGRCLGHSDCEIIWFNVFSVSRKKKSRAVTLT